MWNSLIISDNIIVLINLILLIQCEIYQCEKQKNDVIQSVNIINLILLISTTKTITTHK